MVRKRERMKRPTPLSDLMSAVLRGKPAEQRLEEGKVWLVWDAAVGPQIAVRARPVSFRDGVLTVAVTSAPWMQQLTFLKTGMIEKINHQLGHDLVRDIQLKAGMPHPLSHQPEPGNKPRRQLTEDENRRIGQQTSNIGNAELRDAFIRVLVRDQETK